MPGAKLRPCCASPVGMAEADAPPASEKVSPAAPSAGTAVLVTRFFLEACFTRAMVASSECRKDIHRSDPTPTKQGGQHSCTHENVKALVQIAFIFMNDVAIFSSMTATVRARSAD